MAGNIPTTSHGAPSRVAKREEGWRRYSRDAGTRGRARTFPFPGRTCFGTLRGEFGQIEGNGVVFSRHFPQYGKLRVYWIKSRQMFVAVNEGLLLFVTVYCGWRVVFSWRKGRLLGEALAKSSSNLEKFKILQKRVDYLKTCACTFYFIL